MSSGATPEEQQKARDDLFNNIKDNQKEGLVKEIKDLNDATTASISRFEGLLTAVKTADLKAVGVWKAQYDRTRSTYDVSNVSANRLIEVDHSPKAGISSGLTLFRLTSHSWIISKRARRRPRTRSNVR